ncbi:hypothetical protein QBC45DRAFT_325184, partial [Copromyces sp. CBS 386.78]
PTKHADCTTTAKCLAASLPHFHSDSVRKGGLALPDSQSRYWERIDKMARGQEVNVRMGWRVRFDFSKETKEVEVSRQDDKACGHVPLGLLVTYL